jgi:hypothetical protein
MKGGELFIWCWGVSLRPSALDHQCWPSGVNVDHLTGYERLSLKSSGIKSPHHKRIRHKAVVHNTEQGLKIFAGRSKGWILHPMRASS